MINYLVILLKYKRLIIINMLIVIILAVIYSLLMTKWYKSTALIMPPETDKIGLNLNIPLNLPFAGGLGGDNTFFKFMSILKSRTIKEKLIKEFDLMEEYGEEYWYKAIKAFEENTDIDVTEEGGISLSVYDQDPVKARDITIRYYQLLDSIFTALSVERAAHNRAFLEDRVADVQYRLREAEDSLKSLQQKTGVLAVPEQIISGIEIISDLEAKILQLEIQLNYLEKTIDRNASQYQQVRQELIEYRKALENLKNGENGRQILATLPPLVDIPEITVNYYRRYRDVQIFNKVLEFILPQYEKARLDEAKDTPNVQLLDFPQVPERKAKPKRAYVVLAITFLYFVLLCTYIITVEKLKELSETNPEKYKKLQFIMSNLNPFQLRSKTFPK